MKVCWFGFLGNNHSWSLVAKNISKALIEKGHDVHLFSTNGIKHFPDDLQPSLKGFVEEKHNLSEQEFRKKLTVLDDAYDMQLSYTALRNFQNYFIRGNKNRFGIWNYETTVLPKAFARGHIYVDKVLPSSNFSKKIFLDNGIPNDKQEVIPHGIDLKAFDTEHYKLRTKKRYKILANIAQPHFRKNIPGIFKAYGKAFTSKDDVCLVFKIAKKSCQDTYNVDFNSIYQNFKNEFKDHAEVEIIDNYLPSIEGLYLSCDVVWTMSHCECWWLPGTESFAANKITIAPNYGGQLDFMNEDNSFLIPGKIIRADSKMQYWESSPYAKAFEPDVDEAAKILRKAIEGYDDNLKKFSPNMNAVVKELTWDKVTDKIINLCR